MWEKTELDDLYDAIYRRKSVRRYEQAPLEEGTINELLKRAAELFSPLPNAPVAFRVLGNKQVKGMVSAKAPHYLAVYAGDDMLARVDAAFRLQQMDLWLSAQGYGSCWLGMPNPAPSVKQADELNFVIMLAFGHPAEEARRKDRAQFKRKTLMEITSLSGMERLLEPARLAPSAVNRQPWYLAGNVRGIRLCGKRNNFISKAMFGDLPQIDMGIALCHLWLAAERENKFMAFEREENPKDTPNGYDYVWTVGLK